MSAKEIAQGHIDPVTGLRCGWAHGLNGCPVPDCDFPDDRCVCVKAERGEVSRES